MRILAVTCYTGPHKLAVMTADALWGLMVCIPIGVEFRLSVVSQGSETDPVSDSGQTYVTIREKNLGFAVGMNDAIAAAMPPVEAAQWKPDWVLCFNNDLEFVQKDWLRILLEVAAHPSPPGQIIVPATDKTALYKQPGPQNKPSFPVDEVSAYCWLISFKWCQFLKETYGWWLFDPQFFCFGEDNKTAFLLSKQFGPKIFRVVPRAFVRHLRHQTSKVVKPDRRESSRILKDFFQQELKDPKLRPDLRAWAQRYVRMLRS